MVEGTESIRQDIDAIRGSMTDTMGQIESRVKGTVDTTVENVKRTFDVKQHISDQPWAAMGIAVVAGYVLGSFDSGSSSSQPMPNYSSYNAATTDTSSYSGNGQSSASAPRKPGLLADVMDQFSDEINMLTSAAVTMAVGMLRDTVQQNLPQLGQAYERTKQERQGSPYPNDTAQTSVSSPYADTTAGTYLNGGVSS